MCNKTCLNQQQTTVGPSNIVFSFQVSSTLSHIDVTEHVTCHVDWLYGQVIWIGNLNQRTDHMLQNNCIFKLLYFDELTSSSSSITSHASVSVTYVIRAMSSRVHSHHTYMMS